VGFYRRFNKKELILVQVPKKIANFEIIREIGRGGMGSVYLAKQLPVGRLVAIKTLPSQGKNDPESQNEAVRRFESEARAISILMHDNIVSLYDYGFVNGMHYLAMQYIDGSSLFDIIQKRKPLPIETIIEYSKQICRGLSCAHSKGVVHRDIKPQNILVSKDDNKCHITDFGIARIKGRERVTMVGMAVGTPEYMSPEQAEGKGFDQRTDIYSLGILMYEMCTGNPPFCGEDPISIAYRQVTEIPRNPSKIRHDIPVRLELIILKAIKKNRNERYSYASDVVRDLELVLSEGRDSMSTDYMSVNKYLSGSDNRAVSAASRINRNILKQTTNAFRSITRKINTTASKNSNSIIVGLIILVSVSFAAIIVLLAMLLN